MLLDSALDPVIADTLAKHPSDPHAALLRLAIVDPACGSGHFLLAAARRLATHLARIAAGNSFGGGLSPCTASGGRSLHLWRRSESDGGRAVQGQSVDGSAEPGLPLSFWTHIQHGNSLLGATPALLDKGFLMPRGEPWKAMTKGRQCAQKRNKTEFSGQRTMDSLFATPVDNETTAVTQAVSDSESAADSDVALCTRRKRSGKGFWTLPRTGISARWPMRGVRRLSGPSKRVCQQRPRPPMACGVSSAMGRCGAVHRRDERSSCKTVSFLPLASSVSTRLCQRRI